MIKIKSFDRSKLRNVFLQFRRAEFSGVSFHIGQSEAR